MPLLDRRQREWLRDEHLRTKPGLAGERDAAHYLDNYLKDDPDRMLLHDLRFKVDGDVIQIDHMVITRDLYVYLLETKNFNGSLRIKEARRVLGRICRRARLWHSFTIGAEPAS